MCVYHLKEPKSDPRVYCDEMDLIDEDTVQERSADSAYTENDDLYRVGVLSSETEWGAVLVMDFVDVTIEWTPM